MGKGAVDETHPLSVGVIGYAMGANGSTRHARPLVRDADLVLFVGTRTNENATDGWRLFPPSATYVHLDVDPVEVGRNYEALRLVGDAKLTLRALLDELSAHSPAARTAGREELAALLTPHRRGRTGDRYDHRRFRLRHHPHPGGAGRAGLGRLDPRRAVRAVGKRRGGCPGRPLGGAWSSVMVIPGGTRVPLSGRYTEVVENKRLVIGMNVPGREELAMMTLDLAADGDHTRITLSQTLGSVEERDQSEYGSNMLLDGLTAFL